MMDPKGRIKAIWYIVGIIIVIFVLVLLLVKKDNVNNDELAKYLTEKGVVMYGTEWCPHCKNQKAMFGTSFQYINYVDCDKYPDRCAAANVTGYPTWVINGKSYPGEQSLARLAQLTNYTGAANSK